MERVPVVNPSSFFISHPFLFPPYGFPLPPVNATDEGSLLLAFTRFRSFEVSGADSPSPFCVTTLRSFSGRWSFRSVVILPSFSKKPSVQPRLLDSTIAAPIHRRALSPVFRPMYRPLSFRCKRVKFLAPSGSLILHRLLTPAVVTLLSLFLLRPGDFSPRCSFARRHVSS